MVVKNRRAVPGPRFKKDPALLHQGGLLIIKGEEQHETHAMVGNPKSHQASEQHRAGQLQHPHYNCIAAVVRMRR